MIYLIWFLSLVGIFLLGYFARDTRDRIYNLEQQVKQKTPAKYEEPESIIIDPLDPVQEAQWEQDQMMKKLNEGPKSE